MCHICRICCRPMLLLCFAHTLVSYLLVFVKCTHTRLFFLWLSVWRTNPAGAKWEPKSQATKSSQGSPIYIKYNRTNAAFVDSSHPKKYEIRVYLLRHRHAIEYFALVVCLSVVRFYVKTNMFITLLIFCTIICRFGWINLHTKRSESYSTVSAIWKHTQSRRKYELSNKCFRNQRIEAPANAFFTFLPKVRFTLRSK